jgi:asparagine synthase (glutamine-hydrolysing)
MCGIVGVLGRNGAGPLDLKRSLSLIAHRGPDGEGQWHEAISDGAAISLGHRRLSIIDLSNAASQPMADHSGRWQLVFNGEIYNYIEVRNELQQLGARFRTASDSEVILEAYKRWGRECLSRLNGMFALAIWDREERRLFCARDRYGEKPFLFVAKPAFFAFGSEYKALLVLPGVASGHDEFRLLRAACNPSTGLDADRQTVFDDIQQLLPGEALEFGLEDTEPRIWRYYEPRFDESRAKAADADLFAEFRELLIDSVRLRMRSDVTVGSCLSGGLDSSSIVCIARQLLGDDAPYETFTGVFPGTVADEGPFADAVVAATGVSNHRVEPTVDRFLDELPRFMWHNELPVGGASQFAQWCVYGLANQHGVIVLLDGQGSDEVLGGYETYFAQYVQSLQANGDHGRLQRELPEIIARYPTALGATGRGLRDRLPFRVRHAAANRLGIGTSIQYAIKPSVAQEVLRLNAREPVEGFHPLSSALAQDSFGRFLTTLLRYGDRNSMAHSREVRLPFCDHRIADFALSMPPHMLMGEVQNKRLLRESMRGLLPEAIRTRWKKQGFNPPQDDWFRSQRFLAVAGEMFATPSFRQSPYWIPKAWDRMLARARKGERGLGWTLWQPFIVEVWRKHFLEEIRRVATSPLLPPTQQASGLVAGNSLSNALPLTAQ